jgi:hypothetical protein
MHVLPSQHILTTPGTKTKVHVNGVWLQAVAHEVEKVLALRKDMFDRRRSTVAVNKLLVMIFKRVKSLPGILK